MRYNSLLPLLLPVLATLSNVISITFALYFHITNLNSESQLVTTEPKDPTADPPVFLTAAGVDYGSWAQWEIRQRNDNDDLSPYVLKNIRNNRWLYYASHDVQATPVASSQFASDLEILFIGEDTAIIKHVKSNLYLTEAGTKVMLAPAANNLSQIWFVDFDEYDSE